MLFFFECLCTMKNRLSSICQFLPNIFLKYKSNLSSLSLSYVHDVNISKQQSLALRDITKILLPQSFHTIRLHSTLARCSISNFPKFQTQALPPLVTSQRHLVTYSKLGKFKPNKAVVARFRLTGTGRVKRWRCRTRHNRKRRGRVIMEESWRAQKIRIMLGKSRYNIRRHHCWVD